MSEILNINLNEIVGNLLEEMTLFLNSKDIQIGKNIGMRPFFFFTNFTEQFTKKLFKLLFFHSDNICKVKQMHVLSTTSVNCQLERGRNSNDFK